jgi:hypothetical protein
MKYLIREMREVVVIDNLPCIKKWQESFEVLEEVLSIQSSLKSGFGPDTLVRKNNGEILLLRDEDRGKTILNKEDIIKDINSYGVLKRDPIKLAMNHEYLDYFTMILNKMVSYERDARIDNLLKKEEQEWI